MEALVVGFSYYSDYWSNPSREVARALDGYVVDGLRVRGLVLPVSFKVVREALREALHTTRPALVVGLGLNPSTRTVDIELAAVNRAFFTQPDVDGYVADYEEVESGGPSQYTTLPAREIIGECRARRGLPIKPSLSTGLHLCNAAAYLIMRYGLEMGVPAGFLHVPPSTTNYLRRETGHGLPLRDIVESALCVIEVAIKRGSRPPSEPHSARPMTGMALHQGPYRPQLSLKGV